MPLLSRLTRSTIRKKKHEHPTRPFGERAACGELTLLRGPRKTMSELFDEDPRVAGAGRPPSRRSRALVITAIVLVLAFFALTTFANFYTNVLWYRDIGFGSVYSRLLWTKVVLFLVFGVLMAAVVVVHIVVALRLRPFFHPQAP